MYSKAVLLSVLVAIAEARFGQEQIPIPAISAVTSGGGPGVAATLAGSAVSDLLAAANPCSKLSKADDILTQLGEGADAVAAARGLVAAEQNFNPFNVNIPTLCSDPTLPANALLRGITPLIDPAVGGSDIANKISAGSLVTQLSADGLSVAEVLANAGFSNFTTKDVAGNVGAAPNAGAAPVAVATSGSAAATTEAAAATTAAAATVDCGAAITTFVTVTRAAAATTAAAVETSAAASASASAAPAAADPNAALSPAQGVDPGFQTSSLGLDFGTCTPTVKFEAGLDGRSVTEFTFQAIDPVVNKGQEEALNFNIIFNRICDQLTNVCGAGADGKAACLAAKTKLAAGPRDVTTADAWNTELGFAGTNTNPDNAPQTGLIGHT